MSVAVYQFGLTLDEFYAMTPRNFAALMEQHKNAIRHQELLNAIVSASVVNTSFCVPEKPREFHSFMPSEWARKTEQPKPKRKRMYKAEREFIAGKVHCFLTARMTPPEGTN